LRPERVSGFDPARRIAAEALGTALLVATVIGSGIMGERTAGGSVALALLGNTLATGAILVVLILCFAPVSGAHFNPLVTVVLALRREIERAMVLPYVGAQVSGGLAGTVLAHAMFDLPLFQMSATARSGPGQWLSEAVASFGLVATILACARFRPAAVAYAVGLFISAGYWFTASTSFANPAVALARALTATFSGIRPVDLPGFVIAETAGALIAAAVFGWLLGRRAPAAAPPSDDPGPAEDASARL
jgi:glycerol uptake facilitator-like aquaporin